MLLRQLFDRETSTYTYLVADEGTLLALLIDPVLEQVERDLSLLRELGLSLRYVLETHVHADHVTGASALRERTDARAVASERGAACADLHVKGGDVLELGALRIEVLATPGHTDDSLSYRIGENVFSGDALLVRGSGRTDFQNGDAGQLYDSITKVLFALPDDTVLWPGHDYKGHTRSSIGEERRFNPRLSGKSRAEFTALMSSLGLPRPAQIDRAVPMNRTLGSAALNQAGPAASGVRDIDPAELDAIAAHAHVVDVREIDEWNGELGHLASAEHVPLAQLETRLTDWDKTRAIVMVCRSGRRSTHAAARLVQLGFEQVMNLRGGMLAYREQTAPDARGA